MLLRKVVKSIKVWMNLKSVEFTAKNMGFAAQIVLVTVILLYSKILMLFSLDILLAEVSMLRAIKWYKMCLPTKNYSKRVQKR